jgi:multidrug resistance efflux pump
VPTHKPTVQFTTTPGLNGHGRPTTGTAAPDRAVIDAPPQPDATPAVAPAEATPPAAPTTDAVAAQPPASQTAPAPPKKKGGLGKLLRNLVLGVLLLVVLGVGGTVGYRWYEDSITYVSTDNAQISGPMIQVGGLEAGRVASIRYDVGDRVSRGADVAELTVPVPVAVLPNGAPRDEFTGTTDTVVPVRSPVSGVVVARSGNPGDTVPAGQPLLTIVNPNSLWVTANVEENQAPKLQPGQTVLIHVDNLDADFTGKVAAIAQASAQSFSVIPQQNLSGNYTKVTQLQPVKILLDQTDPRLALGTSVEVKIDVAH